ncbi:MAG TPA: hypothetical protein VFL14_03045 [Xanthomonadales bacterium]|nr:hypothetical protein [Xanthomonadales bacterium]
MFALLPIFLATAMSPCDGAKDLEGGVIRLPGSAVSVVAPEGWWLQTPRANLPALMFELPHACEGAVLAYPLLQVARMDGVDRPTDLDDAARRSRASGGTITEEPRHLTIAGHDAIEYAETDRIIAHYVGGGGSLRPLYNRVVVVQLGDEYFTCWLSEDVIGDGRHHAAPRELCASLAERADAQR